MSRARAAGRPAAGPLALALAALLLAPWPGAAAAPAPRTRNVILITLDGVRIQELFGGYDAAIAADAEGSGIYDPERARRLYLRDTPDERRRALMPFFWGTLAPQGIVLGNAARGSRVRPKNPLLFSAPGYAEIMTGAPRPDVTTNDTKRYPHRTVLEHAQEKLGLGPAQVATIGSWDGFSTLASSRDGAFFTNGGYEAVPPAMATPRMKDLDGLQHRIMTLWETGRSDAVTFGLAMEYLRKHRPRLLWIALDESDDFAHARRYDRYLDYLRVCDDYFRELWTFLQETGAYRGRTSIVITTDHGRGRTPHDWVEHETGIAGSEDAWIAVIGPDTPDAGEAADVPDAHLADVAATMLRLLGLDWRELDPAAGAPIPGAVGP